MKANQIKIEEAKRERQRTFAVRNRARAIEEKKQRKTKLRSTNIYFAISMAMISATPIHQMTPLHNIYSNKS